MSLLHERLSNVFVQFETYMSAGETAKAYQLFERVVKAERAGVIHQAITAIQNCEPVAPNVKRIRIDEAVGSLVMLKDNNV